MVPYSAQIRTRAERKSSQMERAHLLWSYDCRQVDVLKLITEGRWSTGRVTIGGGGGSVGEQVCGRPARYTSASSRHPDFGVRVWVMHTGSSGGAVGAWRASSSGPMISVTAYSEIAAHDHRNYPEAVNANR
jgi:hypothetical protein